MTLSPREFALVYERPREGDRQHQVVLLSQSGASRMPRAITGLYKTRKLIGNVRSCVNRSTVITHDLPLVEQP